MRKTLFFTALCIILTSFAVFNRNNFTDLVQEKLENYSKNEWPEKTYVQTDKPYYSVGESIWFTAYLVNGITNAKSSKSYVLYVELINDKDSILDKKKLYTTDISAAGNFKIGKDWKEGNYLLRAYTNYMRNSDSDYFFQKGITIWGLDEKEKSISLENADSSQEATISEKPDLNFYPEGGYLVENVTSKVAIKIKNDIYNKINLSGNITDSNNTVVSQFSTIDFGLGLFILTPEPNKTYYANIEINGSEYRYSLPEALPLGYTINVINKGEQLLVDIKSTTLKGLIGTYLVIHQRGDMLFNKLETENKNNYSLILKTDKLRDGVTHLTLFNSEGNPVCERLVFIDNPKNKATIAIKKDKEVFGSREKFSLNLDVKDSDGNNLPSHLSMSIRDMNTFPYNNRSKNIKTWLLLNSDLRGEVKDPGYFFNKDADFKSRYLLDLVMMTNGWSRFTWQGLFYGKKLLDKYQVEKGITLSGTTKFLKSPYTATPAYSKLTFFGDQIIEEPIQKSNSQGKFSFGPYIFYDSIQTLVQSRLTNFKSKDEQDRNVLILMDQDKPSPKVSRSTILKSNITTEKQIANFLKISKYISDINLEFDQQRQKLEEITIIARKKTQESERKKEMDDRVRFGYPTNRLDIESDITLSGQSVFDLLRRFTGVTVFGNTVSIRGAGEPRILLDDFPIDIDFLKTLYANEVSFIDVYKGADAAMYSNAGNGVIVIYSRIGNSRFSRNVKRKPGIINFAAEGFYTAKEFYSPDPVNGFEAAIHGDVRTTLYWEPIIRISEKQQTKEISFFTCDIKSDYIIEIEGLSDSGIPLHQISTFSVQ
ncbi:TonB-dependent receptor plug domain-containing protein [Yeosuana marina]|uniref:TonB-dependent receptor plug domain-containing protein n=1 Tax=Yeosuana marina TaxID=1565536 RepID=UPI0030C8A8F5